MGFIGSTLLAIRYILMIVATTWVLDLPCPTTVTTQAHQPDLLPDARFIAFAQKGMC